MDPAGEIPENIEPGDEAVHIGAPTHRDEDGVYHLRQARGTILDWDNLPKAFDSAFVRPIRRSDIDRLRDPETDLTPAQRSTFADAERAIDDEHRERMAEFGRNIAKSVMAPHTQFLKRLQSSMSDSISPKLRQSFTNQDAAIARLRTPKYETARLDQVSEGIQQAMNAKREREDAILELAQATAESTRVLAERSEQERTAGQQARFVTIILSVAVIFDITNAGFNDHSWRTAAISGLSAVLVVTLASRLGKWIKPK